MRLLFAGGSDFSLPSLRKLIEEFTLTAVLTHPDTEAGRGKKITVNPVKGLALEKSVPILEPEKLDRQTEEPVLSLTADLLVVVAYGKIFPGWFIDLFPEGGINLHPSLLPKYRGPSPVTAAILNGDEETGITVQKLARKMDAGDILAQITIPLRGDETTASLLEETSRLGAGLLTETIRKMRNGRIDPIAQDDSKATYCGLIKKEDGKIDWALPADKIERMVRAYQPWPKAYCSWRQSTLFLLEAAVYGSSPKQDVPGTVLGMDKKEGILIQTGNGVLAVTRLQLQAKKAVDFKSFLNGAHHFIGSQLE